MGSVLAYLGDFISQSLFRVQVSGLKPMGSPEHPQFEPAPNEKASVVLILFQFVLQFLEAD